MWTPGPEILSVAEMTAIDRLAVAGGTPLAELMEHAGRQTANEIAKRWQPQKTVVLCGPGNNGGDGYVVARHLRSRGFDVTILSIGDHRCLKEPAAQMAREWQGPVKAFSLTFAINDALCVDAVFGAGLSRPIEPALAEFFRSARKSGAGLIAVDVPSGVSGDQARFLDAQDWTADLTVTFFRRKAAHVLMPGRAACGDIVLADIGISDSLIEALREFPDSDRPRWAGMAENMRPTLHQTRIAPWAHKYHRGYAVVVCGPGHATGAGRLAAEAALRVGAGLVTLACPADAAGVVAAQVTSVMVAPLQSLAGFEALLRDGRKNTVILGPGNGVGEETRKRVTAALRLCRNVVLDADALTSFSDTPGELERLIKAGLARDSALNCVLTPHEGEFERIFPGLLNSAANRIEAAKVAALRSGAVVVLKGADTVIAEPGMAETFGYALVNTNAPPDLATAGSGDVLAGIIGGLLAQGLEAGPAAAAGVWLHGAAGNAAGPGLIAEDLPHYLGALLGPLRQD